MGREKVTEAIKRCKVFILMLSKVSIKSQHVMNGVAQAKEFGKPILPVYLEPVEVPEPLQTYLIGTQPIKLYQGNEKENFQAILEALARLGVNMGDLEKPADGTALLVG
jgi:hypothetical protein